MEVEDGFLGEGAEEWALLGEGSIDLVEVDAIGQELAPTTRMTLGSFLGFSDREFLLLNLM